MTDRDRSATPQEPERLTIGRVVGPHGVRGEVRMYILTQFPERIAKLPGVYLGDEEQPRKVRRARLKGNLAIMRIEGVDDRDAAEALRDQLVRIDLQHAAPLEEGEYFHYQIIGLQAIDDEGRSLGEVVEIIETGANDVYVIRDAEGNDTLVPALRNVVPEIDPEAGTMTVRPLKYFDDA
jgi:16S rRNA processing protein RimM